MTYEINLTGVQTMREIHERIKTALSLPDHYGMNLDALWDCLTAFVKTPCTICLTGLDNIPASLSPRVDSLVGLMQDASACHAARGREMHISL